MVAAATVNIITNMQNDQIPNKKERQELSYKRARMKRVLKTTLFSVLGIGAVGALIWYSATRPEPPEGEIVSRGGVHWHPELAIYIKGQKQVVPANIGIGMQYAGYPRFDPMMKMTDMHTHDESGTLHWEVMKGPVTKDDVRIGSFFRVWGKTFSKDCIFDSCNGPDGTVKMFVNGKENAEFENYLVNDKDKIEIRYE